MGNRGRDRAGDEGTEVTPVVRVPANDAVFIKKALDRGGHGVVVPLVNTAAHAAAAVAAAKFPPDGIRGVAGARPPRDGPTPPHHGAPRNRGGAGVRRIEGGREGRRRGGVG